MRKPLALFLSLGLSFSMAFASNTANAEDVYQNYAELSANEVRGVDYEIYSQDVNSDVTILAIHGGGIEQGTSELARAIAGSKYNYYDFQGLKPSNNGVLHITSTHFDEPTALKLTAKANKVVSIHGAGGDQPIVYLGGRDARLKENVRTELTKAGFQVADAPSNLDGDDLANICNMNRAQQGVQLELTTALRKQFFEGGDLSRDNRVNTTPEFAKFVTAVQTAIELTPSHAHRTFDFSIDSFATTYSVFGGKPLYMDANDYLLAVQNPLNPNDTIDIAYEVTDTYGKRYVYSAKTTTYRNGLVKVSFSTLPKVGYYKIKIINRSQKPAYIYGGIHY